MGFTLIVIVMIELHLYDFIRKPVVFMSSVEYFQVLSLSYPPPPIRELESCLVRSCFVRNNGCQPLQSEANCRASYIQHGSKPDPLLGDVRKHRRVSFFTSSPLQPWRGPTSRSPLIRRQQQLAKGQARELLGKTER